MFTYRRVALALVVCLTASVLLALPALAQEEEVSDTSMTSVFLPIVARPDVEPEEPVDDGGQVVPLPAVYNRFGVTLGDENMLFSCVEDEQQE
jgi:hypothetical protein